MDELSKVRLSEIIAMDKNDLTQEHIDFLKARRTYLNDEQRARFAEFLNEKVPVEKVVKAKVVKAKEAIKIVK